ncbi:MAG: reverse transcriptase/maturase, partial [Actinobacteria bacterium]|nr:reverse transcriptase/maturase [Actinomycetota bacterium]
MRLDDGSRMSGDVQVRFCERRGVRFPPATLLTIYVRSERAAQRVMQSTCSFIERRLKLRVNRGKSSVGSAFKVT